MGVRESFVTSVTGYEIAGTDIKNLAEPYDQNGGVNTGKVSLSPYKRTGTSDTLNKQFASPTDSWNTLTTNFKINGTAIKLAKRGCVPTGALQFASLTSTGTYEIKRGSDSSGDYIKIGSTYYRASSFGSLGFVPYVIGCIFSGGGGGAGGHGGKTGNKWGWNATCGGGGGGAGVCIATIDLRNGYFKITLGAGGVCGTNNSQATAGTAGSNGGISKLIAYDSSNTEKYNVSATYGFGGEGGKTGTDGDFQGAGGSCGDGYEIPSNSWIVSSRGVAGGKGGTSSDGGTSTSGESVSGIEKFNGSYSRAFGGAGGSSAFDSSDSGRGTTRAGGGGSLGAGATNSSYATAGGGGACYYYNTTYFNGANGAAYFYY